MSIRQVHTRWKTKYAIKGTQIYLMKLLIQTEEM